MAGRDRFLSTSWYRVAGLKLRLREHVTTRMHRYRGQLWYVIGDGVRNRVHRVSPSGYMLVAAMDGTRTLDSLWSDAAVSLGEQAATQDQVIELLGQLHSNDLIAADVTPESRDLFERQDKANRSTFVQWLLNPLAMRFPLLDPNEFLTRTLPFVRPFLGRLAGIVWLAVVLTAVVLAGQHWTDLTQNVDDRVLEPGNLLLIAGLYPVIKLLHEFGHGYTTRAHGGECHELGVMLLVLLPMPYVEVSSAAGFRSKWTRCLVGAAGIMVELFIAAVALFVWLTIEPGFARAVAFNVMLTASVSSLLFNGNPLLRYDGYYVLSDLIEVPNLATRGRQYWSHLMRRYAFGTKDMEDFAATRGERIWFISYLPIATAYRLSVTVGIALFLMGKYLAVGVLLALWGVTMGILLPVGKGLWSVISSPAYLRNRFRALSVCCGLAVVAIAFLFQLPMPLHTTADGVVWLADDAFVRAGADGFVTAVRTTPGSLVSRGDIVVESVDPDLAAQVKLLLAKETELVAKLDSVRFTDRITAYVTEAELSAVRAERSRDEHQAALLTMRADRDGVFTMPDPDDAPGRYLKRGDTVAYVLPRGGATTIRTVITQQDIDLVRNHAVSTRIILSDGRNQPIDVIAVRQVPGGQNQLPNAALGPSGGGDNTVDPHDDHGMKTLNHVFQVDLDLTTPVPNAGFGGRAFIRFDHRWEPLGWQIWRRARQLLLSRVEI
jgi:putative peptide zinc metalloprotease protein